MYLNAWQWSVWLQQVACIDTVNKVLLRLMAARMPILILKISEYTAVPFRYTDTWILCWGKRKKYHGLIPYTLPSSKSQDSVVGIATHYGLHSLGIGSWRVEQDFQHLSQLDEAHPASYTMGTGSIPGSKAAGCGVGHPPHLAPSLKKE
jgi:hypothetical protein